MKYYVKSSRSEYNKQYWKRGKKIMDMKMSKKGKGRSSNIKIYTCTIKDFMRLKGKLDTCIV